MLAHALSHLAPQRFRQAVARADSLILVDTSSWIHFLRHDDDALVRNRVENALTRGDACWCALVRLELWNGARGQTEKKVIEDFERIIPELPVNDSVCLCSFQLAKKARSQGIVAIPATDVLIAACARFHGALIETADSDFDMVQSIS